MKNQTLKMKAPDGYRLSSIIATSFDLDLAVLRGLLAEYPKVDWKFFCDESSLIDTENDTLDYSKLENIVFPVSMPFYESQNGTPKQIPFHPKVWIFKYKNNDNAKFYRISVGSCNITKYDNLEVEFCAEGYVDDNLDSENIDVVNFFQELKNYTSINPMLLEELLSDLKKIKFNPISNIPIDSFEIIFTGAFFPKLFNYIKDKLNVMLPDFDECFVISGFISEYVIRRINDALVNPGQHCTIITCKNEMDRISEEFLNSLSENLHFEIWDDNSYRPHAKMYLCRKGNSVKGYLGSKNATTFASFSTLEAMVYFTIKDSKLSLNEIADYFFVK